MSHEYTVVHLLKPQGHRHCSERDVVLTKFVHISTSKWKEWLDDATDYVTNRRNLKFVVRRIYRISGCLFGPRKRVYVLIGGIFHYAHIFDLYIYCMYVIYIIYKYIIRLITVSSVSPTRPLKKKI